MEFITVNIKSKANINIFNQKLTAGHDLNLALEKHKQSRLCNNVPGKRKSVSRLINERPQSIFKALKKSMLPSVEFEEMIVRADGEEGEKWIQIPETLTNKVRILQYQERILLSK
jgi:hypothetical protein